MKKVILLAEDSPDDEVFFRRVLNATGIVNPITVVRTGDEVISYLKAEGAFANRDLHPLPTVLFLDLLMPGGDGWDVLKWMRVHPVPGKMLIVVLTGPAQRQRLREAYQAGANSFLLKPFNREELDGLLEMWPDAWVRPAMPQPLPPPSLGAAPPPP